MASTTTTTGTPRATRVRILDAWVWELIEAAPPLTGEQRRALALLLYTPAPVPARPGGKNARNKSAMVRFVRSRSEGVAARR